MADSKGRAFGRPSQWAKLSIRRAHFRGVNCKISLWDVLQEGPFCKKKGALSTFLMVLPFVSPEGGIEIAESERDEKTAEQKKGPWLAPDEAFLRSPEGGIETTESGREEKTAEQKGALAGF